MESINYPFEIVTEETRNTGEVTNPKRIPTFWIIPVIILLILIIIFLFSTKKYVRKRRIINDKNKEVAITKRKIKKLEEKNVKKYEDIERLAILYHNGVNDYTLYDGTVINGIKPDFRKAIKCYEYLIENYPNCKNINIWRLNLGDIYNFGYTDAEEDLIDKQKAQELYAGALASVNPLNFQFNFQNDERDFQINNINEFPQIQGVIPTYFEDDYVNLDVNNINQYNNPYEGGQREQRALVIENINVPAAFIIDNQNVHDSGISHTIKNSIENLRNNTDIQHSQHNIVVRVRNYIDNSNLNIVKKQNAHKTLDKILTDNAKISNANMNEIEGLQLIVNRIDHLSKSQNFKKDDLVENLIDSLSDAVEHGNVVCSVGRFNRVINSLNQIDPEVNIKTKEYLSLELQNLAAKIRNDTYQNLDEDQKRVYTNPQTPDESKVSEEIDQNIRQQFNERLENDYIKSNIASKEWIDNETKGYFSN